MFTIFHASPYIKNYILQKSVYQTIELTFYKNTKDFFRALKDILRQAQDERGRKYLMKKSVIHIIFLLTISHAYSMDISTNNLTLDQKIGQLFMVAAVADEEVAKDFIHKK